jgi:cell wall-associated NlpC family hydrolase
VGVPFRHQGRDRRGIDCVGLPIVVMQALGAIRPDFEATDYPRLPYRDQLLQGILRHCNPVPAPIPGCLVAIKWRRTLAHVAIYSNTGTLIHALQRNGAVVEHGFRGRWLSRLVVGSWALPGVSYE